MAIQTPALNSFAAGELSPLLDGRTDLAKYYVGLKTLLNMIAYPTGGATRRGGFKFIAEVKNGYNAASAVRLVPFEFSTTQAYMLEVGDQYIRVMRDQGQILWTEDPNQASHTFDVQQDWTDISIGAGQIGWNSSSKAIDVYAASNTASGWAEFQFANLASPEVIHRLSLENQNQATPIYAGVGDVRTISSASFDIAALVQQNAGSVTIDFDPNGATQIYVGLVNQNEGSATVDNVILRRKYFEIFSPYTTPQLFDIKYAQSADTMFKAHPSVHPQELTRTGHQDFTIADVLFISGVANAGGDIFATDFPAVVSFFEGRSAWAATNNEPQAIWLSETTDIYDFSTGSNAASAIKATIRALKVNRIRWLIPLSDLLFGTTGGLWRIGATTTAEPVTPSNVSARQTESEEGSSDIQAIGIKNGALFNQFHGQRLMRAQFTFNSAALSGAWEAEDLTILSDHIIGGDDNVATMIEMAWQQYPHRILWAVRSDGVLIGLTYNKAQDIVSWHRHTSGTEDNQASFESVAVVPGTQKDDVYVVVRRNVNGTIKRYIELLSDDRIRVITDGRLLDSYLDYVGDNDSSVIAVSGLDHLNGASVSISVDGATHPDRTVENNSVTLDNLASQVVVGIKYDSELETMRLEAGSELGSALGKVKRIARAIILFYRSAGCEYGTDEDNLDTLAWRKTSDKMDAAPELVNEAIEVSMPGDWERAGRIIIKQSLPLPLTVLAIVPRVDTSED